MTDGFQHFAPSPVMNRHATRDMYRHIFKDSPDAIFILDLDRGNILDLNIESETLFKYKPGEMKGKKFSSLFLLKDRKRLEDMISGLIPGKADTGIFFLEKMNEKPLSLEINAQAFTFSGKKMARIMGSNASETRDQAANEELSAINYIGATVNSTLDLDVMLDRTIHKVCEVTDMDIGCIFLLDDSPDMLTLYAYAGQVIPHPTGSMKVSQCVGGTAVVEKKPIAFEDFSKCPEKGMGMRIFQECRFRHIRAHHVPWQGAGRHGPGI